MVDVEGELNFNSISMPPMPFCLLAKGTSCQADMFSSKIHDCHWLVKPHS